MRRSRYNVGTILLLLAAGWTSAQAQEQTVGLFINDERASDGYTLFAPLLYMGATYLIDNNGRLVHSWEHTDRPGSSAYLLPNGHLLRAARTGSATFRRGGRGGRIEEIAWDGATVWEFVYSDSLHALHHDMAMLPNGNVLMIAWEYISAEEAIAAGRNPDSTSLPTDAFWPDQIIEVRPTPPEGGEIVWTWRAWDHLIQDFDSTKANFGVVRDHPELIDVNYGPTSPDWMHTNAVYYNPELDQIILSIFGFGEFWVIDHSTTTEEAAGHTGGRYGKGGDLLYRWGNPEAYRAGTADDRRLYNQHDVQWIEPGLPGAGNILLFNNNPPNPRRSEILELALPIDENGVYSMEADGSFSPPEEVWHYQDVGAFFSNVISGAHRLPNGHTLIAEGTTGRIFEVTPDGEIVWEYVNPVTSQGPLVQGDPIPLTGSRVPAHTNQVFRAIRYGPDYAGLQGKDLTPKSSLELMPTATQSEAGISHGAVLAQNYPNPFNATTTISFTAPRSGAVQLTVFDALGRQVARLTSGHYEPGTHLVHFDAADLPSGVYFYRINLEGFTATKLMQLVR